jgi:CBS domain-containing protein
MTRHKIATPVRQHPEIREHMSSSPLTIGPASSLSKAVKLMRDHHVRHLPVVDGRGVVGVLSQRDILRRADRRAGQRPGCLSTHGEKTCSSRTAYARRASTNVVTRSALR